VSGVEALVSQSWAAQLKGGGLETLWRNFLALALSALALLTLSIMRFRQQLV